MKKNSNTITNYLFNVAYNFFVLLIPLITTPYISRVLSVESIGVYSYIHSIVLYFTAFVALGTKSYAIKQISRAKDVKEYSNVFWNVLVLRITFGFLALIIYYYISIVIIKQTTVALIQSLYIIGVMLDISWFFQGLENFRIIVIRNFLIKIISCICIFLFVRDDTDLNKYVLCLAGMTALGNLSLWPYLKKYITKSSHLTPFSGIQEIVVLFIPTLALQIYSAIDQTMLGIMVPKIKTNL